MIVQANVDGCKGDKPYVILDITGGKPKYTIVVESEAGTIEDQITENTYAFLGEPGLTYSITVYDEQGLVAQVEILLEQWNFNVELGPDQYLSASQPEVTLHAGGQITDPDASYQWYFNGLLMSENSSSITVNEPGVYEVVVTSADQSCQVSDKVEVLLKGFNVELTPINGCGTDENVLSVDIDGGASPFTTSLVSASGTINYAHSGSTNITDLPYGYYQVTVSDNLGNTHQEGIDFYPPIELDIYAQLEALCVNSQY